MRAAILYGKKDVRIERAKRPQAGSGQVVIQIKAVGICGSDVHYYEEFRMGTAYQLEAPQILGHEASGVIVEIGEGVTGFHIGDRVSIEPGESCGNCFQCKTGHYNLCRGVRFLSVPGNKGAFAEYLVMNADMVFLIPDTMSYEVACLAEPLSVGIHACELAHVCPGVRLMVLGAGPIGIMAIAAARAFGVTNITVGDIQQNRLDFAKQHCHVNNTINTSQSNVKEIIDAFTDGEGFDCVIETSGAPQADYMSVDLVRKGGVISLIGIPREEAVPFHIFDIIDKEVTLKGVFRYANTYPTAIEILSSGVIDFEAVISRRFELAQTAQALDFALNNKKNAIKTVIINSGE